MLRERVSSALMVVADGVWKEDESVPLVRVTLKERTRRATAADLEDSGFPADIEPRDRTASMR